MIFPALLTVGPTRSLTILDYPIKNITFTIQINNTHIYIYKFGCSPMLVLP